MKLKATRREYRLEDPSGYSFDVVAEEHPDRGWGATVVMKTGGYMSAEDAISKLAETAREFIRQVKESDK
jgi:hypothetical protein